MVFASIKRLLVAAVVLAGATSADLTPYPPEYDGYAVMLLWDTAVIGKTVATFQNKELKTSYTKMQKTIRKSVDAGKVTSKIYAKELDKVLSVAADDERKMILGNLTMNAVDLTTYVSVAPTYWFDYYFDLLSRTAKAQPNNQAIVTKVESCKKQVETDIKKGPTVINQYVTTFRTEVQTIAPTFVTVVQEHCHKFDVQVKVEINVPAPPPDLPYPHYEPHYEADFATSNGDIFVFWPDDSDDTGDVDDTDDTEDSEEPEEPEGTEDDEEGEDGDSEEHEEGQDGEGEEDDEEDGGDGEDGNDGEEEGAEAGGGGEDATGEEEAGNTEDGGNEAEEQEPSSPEEGGEDTTPDAPAERGDDGDGEAK